LAVYLVHMHLCFFENTQVYIYLYNYKQIDWAERHVLCKSKMHNAVEQKFIIVYIYCTVHTKHM